MTLERERVAYTDMRDFIRLLDEKGLLHHVTAEVDPVFELGAVAARSLERQGPAIIFDNVKGYPDKPMVVNLLSTIEQVALAFGTEPDEAKIHERVVGGMDHRLPSVQVDSGPCKDVIVTGDDVDLDFIPTPVWHEHDGGQYLATTAGVVTRDPVTGILNIGLYRAMIKDKQTLSLSGGVRGRDSSTGPGGGDHILDNEAEGRPTPIAIVMGTDPLVTLAAGSPVRPDTGELEGSMEYEAAGGWRGEATQLVKCETSDLLVPADSEVVIEGEVVPNERTEEGPHGESTGFYGQNLAAFVIKVKAITHRKDPLTYGLICQRVEDYPRQLLRSGSMQSRLIERTGKTNIREVYFPEVGRRGMLIVSADIQHKEEPREIMEAIWDAEAWRWIIVVDDDCNVRDWEEVMWRVVSAAEPDDHVIFGREFEPTPRLRGEVDFTPPRRGMGIDATMKFKDNDFPPVNKVSRHIMEGVASRWDEFGLP